MDQYFKVKDDSIGQPTRYLGAKIELSTHSNGEQSWSMGSGQYVMEAVRNAETWFNNRNKKLKTRAPTVMPFTYKPELDTTRLLDDEDTNSYQQHIGVPP